MIAITAPATKLHREQTGEDTVHMPPGELRRAFLAAVQSLREKGTHRYVDLEYWTVTCHPDDQTFVEAALQNTGYDILLSTTGKRAGRVSIDVRTT